MMRLVFRRHFLRRLDEFNTLAEEGSIDAAAPVACLVVSADDAGEFSLAENVVRLAMHPADQVVAFMHLVKDGVTSAKVTARFGVAERVIDKRLRFGNLASELLDAYRANNATLKVLQAFTITSDHERHWRFGSGSPGPLFRA